MNEQQHVLDIKSDLLTLSVNSIFELNSMSEYFDLLKTLLATHFDIHQCSFLVYEQNMFISVKGDLFSRNESEDLPWSLFEPYFVNGDIANIPYFLNEKENYKHFSKMILLRQQNEPVAIMLLKETEKWVAFKTTTRGKEVVAQISKITRNAYTHLLTKINEQRFRKLYNMTELFHSSMDVDLILKNVLITINQNFPTLTAELILSNDQDRLTTMNIKPFDYLDERASTIEAFVSGEVTYEETKELDVNLLNAPIKGRQAIYGILQVSVPKTYKFYKEQKDFIRMLAQASGNALENAKLYHQSHHLVRDLQLINETTHRLNSNLNVDEMLSLLHTQLSKSFQPKEVGFIIRQKGKLHVSDLSSPFFKTLESDIYLHHVEKHFEHTGDSLFVADFSRLSSLNSRYKSMMAIPIMVEEKIKGYCIVLHSEPYFFSFDSFKLMQSLIHHSSLAIANSTLQEKLRDMINRDHLTGLFARRYLDGFVEQSIERDQSGMFMLIDIDNFKRVNDTYGHQVGDDVLMQIGKELQRIIGDFGVCARWGGEELAVYVPNISSDEAQRYAACIVKKVPQATSPSVTISAGLIVWHAAQRPEFQSLFLMADTALYTAKNNGKNQVRLFDESMQLQ